MAQEEEKKIEEQNEGKEEVEGEEAAEEAEEQQPMELPPVTFENYIFGLYNTALFHLGIRNPETGELIQNLPVARHTIDTLGMIQEKTKGNLTAPEGNLMENLLYELRMNYLRAAKQAEEEPKEEPEAKPEEEPEKEEEKADDGQ
jgi:hypothetical protein